MADEHVRLRNKTANVTGGASGIGHYGAMWTREFVYRGQVRHLLSPELWRRTFVPVAAGTYQNGAYWGTASGWLIEALATIEPALAERSLADLLKEYGAGGVF